MHVFTYFGSNIGVEITEEYMTIIARCIGFLVDDDGADVGIVLLMLSTASAK